MRCVLQRVSRASVEVEGEKIAAIGPGLVALVGVGCDDDSDAARWLAAKIAAARIFDDGSGRMGKSAKEVGGAVLCISQFTLYGDLGKGTRPSFSQAAGPEQAEPIYDELCNLIKAQGVEVRRGRFGAPMTVDLVNDGPVTLTLEC